MGSVLKEISRLETAKQDIETAIEYCGVDVPDTELIDTYANYIKQIPSAVFSGLNVDPIGGDDAYIKTIKQTNGLITATTGGLVSTTSSGLVPKANAVEGTINSQDDWVLAKNESSVQWYKLPVNAFANTTYSFTNGTLGNFTVTPLGGTAQTISIGKPATACTADEAIKLDTKRKLWGLDFDGSEDVSGNMAGVGVINKVFKVTSTQDIAQLNVSEEASTVNYLHLYVSSNNTSNTNSRPLVLQNGYGNVGIGIIDPTQKLEVNGNVKATSFIGNLDGTYINQLTGYSKTSSESNVAATDTLNTALGKIEYKAHFAYLWITSVTASDTDEYINKWGEIVGFLDSVKEDTDILDEFVTRNTDLTITGLKDFTETVIVSKLLLLKGSERSDIINVQNDDGLIITNAPTTSASIKNALQFNWYDTSWEIGNIRGNSSNTDGFGITAGKDNLCFRVTTTNCYVGSNAILHTGNTYINNGTITINGVSITPLTLHLSLANYLPLSGGTLTSANYNILNIKRDTVLDVGVAINFLNNNGDICDIMADPVTKSLKRGRNSQTYTIWDEGNDGTLMRFRGSVSTNYVDLTNTGAGDVNYTNLNPGIYVISREKYSELLVSFAANTGSTSSLELKTSYEHNSKLYIRKTIDANRICGAWRALAFHDDISESINKYYWANLKLSETPANNTAPIFGLTTATYYVATLQMTLHPNGLSKELTVANRGGLFSNGIIFTNSGTSSDVGFIRLLGNAEDNTVLEIGTDDDGATTNSEAIAARLYRNGDIAKEAWLLDTVGNTSFPGIVTSAGFVRAGSADTHILLGGGGHKAISDFLLKSDILTNNLETIKKTLKITKNWMDTGISGTNLTTGTYIIQVTVNGGSMTECIWSGTMSWYNGTCSDIEADEILLHRSGKAYSDTIYLRTIMLSSGTLKLQIAADSDLSASYEYTFKFKRVI